MSEHGQSCPDQARRCEVEHCILAPVVSGNNGGTVDANGVGERRQNRHCSEARPEEGGTMKPSRKNMTIIMRMNSGPDTTGNCVWKPSTEGVSEIRPFSIIRLAPRAGDR